MKLLFFGSPDFAVPALRALHAAGHDIALVVTRPDRPRGRTRKPLPTPVKEAARELGLDVFQPQRSSAPESVQRLRAVRAELGVVVAYGEILSPEVLSVAERGFVNLHASLLPDYRGAAPVHWAVIRGETETGVSVIRMEPRLDAGPILDKTRVKIGEDETAGELEARLADVGAALVAAVVDRMAAGEYPPGSPQPDAAGFFARKLTKADGAVDWSESAEAIRNRVRGLNPWPGAYCDVRAAGGRHRVTLLRVEAMASGAEAEGHEAGLVLRADEEGVVVQAGRGAVRIKELKPAGGRAMNAPDFVHGYRVAAGDRFR
jgi:methionyl-tRNA formyltransferase